MGGKTKSAGLPQTLLLKCGAFGNIFSCTFLLFKPLWVSGTFIRSSTFLGLNPIVTNFIHNMLQTVYNDRWL